MINWDEYRKDGGPIELRAAIEDNIENFHKLPPEDVAMVEELIREIEYLQPIRKPEVAAIALVMVRQFLISAQILGTILGQMGVVMKSAEDINAEKNREGIKIVSSNRMPKDKR